MAVCSLFVKGRSRPSMAFATLVHPCTSVALAHPCARDTRTSLYVGRSRTSLCSTTLVPPCTSYDTARFNTKALYHLRDTGLFLCPQTYYRLCTIINNACIIIRKPLYYVALLALARIFNTICHYKCQKF